MERIVPGQARPLHDTEAARRLEQAAAAGLPPHTLMQRAGLAVARLARALAPHARSAWVACGPGNNGGDGLEAAALLAARGVRVSVTWMGQEDSAPADARASLARARAAGVAFTDTPPDPAEFAVNGGLAVDALFGLGQARPLEGAAATLAACLNAMRDAGGVVLAVDLPSGLAADTGTVAAGSADTAGAVVHATHTLSLLTLKPGLFTAQGRDAAGEVWFDDLGVTTDADPHVHPAAWLAPAPAPRTRRHASHKGSQGDVAVVGGAPGMVGAALLAASAALHAGAGRVFAALLDAGSLAADPSQPELMFRPPESLDVSRLHLACGCGGGDAVRQVLPRALSTARSLVLDADALNAVAADPQLLTLVRARTSRQMPTVLTPHPLEAARLLGVATAQVQADRLAAARQLVAHTGAVVALKGSGTVVAAPGQVPRINPTGNGRLATGGTGDVLAGWIAALQAQGLAPMDAASEGVYAHGAAADAWPEGSPALVASSLARAAR